MKKLFNSKVILLALLFLFNNNISWSQATCHLSNITNDEAMEQAYANAILTGALTPAEVQRQKTARQNRLKARNSSISVLVVYRNAATSRGLSVAAASTILNAASAAGGGCNVAFTPDVTTIDYDFSPTGDANAAVMLPALYNAAVANGWYTNHDLVIGITDLDMTFGGNNGVAGLAYTPNTCGVAPNINNGRALVIEGTIYNSLFAHEMGHTIGLQHDDTDPGIADHTKSVMNSTVYSNANTMAVFNKNCYRTSANCVVLGVELSEFTGKSEKNGNQLAWATASETNNLGFEIQSSSDGYSWVSVGFVKGNGASNELKKYDFFDKNTAKLVYYRLKQTDFEGKEAFSPVVSLVRSNGKSKISVYPNPTSGRLQIEGEYVSASIFNNIGQLVLAENNVRELDVSSLQTGVYFVKIKTENGSFETLKLLKQ